MTNSNTNTMKNQDQLWDELVELRDSLECIEEDNDSRDYVLEDIFFCLDDMRGGKDMTDEALACIEDAKYVLLGNKII